MQCEDTGGERQGMGQSPRTTKERGGGKVWDRGSRAKCVLPQQEEAHSGKCKWYFLVPGRSVHKKKG